MADTQLIISLRAEQQQLRSDLAKAKGSMTAFSRQSQTIANRISTSLAVAFGGFAVVQGIKSTIGVMIDFEYQMDKVAAISGASTKELESLTRNARKLGAVSKFTATEIGELELELSKLGFDTGQILASTDAIRKLATVADAGLAESAKTLAGTLNGFNLEASESERVANVMAEAFSKSALTLEKFTVGTANSSAIASVMGVTLEENTARMGALVDANIDASKAGTDLRKIYLSLNEAGVSYSEALEMVANSSDKAGTAQKLVDIRAAGALVILSQQKTKVDALTEALSDNNREMNNMVGIMEDNLHTDLLKLLSAFQELTLRGGALVPVLRNITQGLTEMVNILNGTGDSAKILKLLYGDESEWGKAEKRREWLEEFVKKMDSVGSKANKDYNASEFGGLGMLPQKSSGGGSLLLDQILKTDNDKTAYQTWLTKQEAQIALVKKELANMVGGADAASGDLGNLGFLSEFLFGDDDAAALVDQFAWVGEEVVDEFKKIKEELTDMETVGVAALQHISAAMMSGVSANEAFTNALAASQRAVVSMLIERAAAYLFADGAKTGLPGLLAAAAGLTLMTVAMKKIGNVGSSSTTGSVSTTNFRTGQQNTITGTLRFVQGAGGLTGIIQGEQGQNSLRGGG